MDHNLSLVLDLGKSFLRLGYSGDDSPRIISESYLAYASESNTLKQDWDQTSGQQQSLTKEIFAFGEKLHEFNPGYIYESLWTSNSGFSLSLRASDLFSKEILPNKLSLESKVFPLLMSEDNNTTKEERRQLLQLFLDSGVTTSFLLMRQSLLSLYACGKINGAVVDSSSFTTSVSTIEEGYFVQEGFTKINFGGENITDKISQSFSKDRFNILPEALRSQNQDLSELDVSFFDYERKVLAREIKHGLLSESGNLYLARRRNRRVHSSRRQAVYLD